MENPAPTANVQTGNTPAETTEAKLARLFNCNNMLYEDELLSKLSRDEKNAYHAMLHHKLAELNGQQDLLMDKIAGLTNTPNSELIRESNQRKIHTAMHRLLNINGQMPSKTQIAQATGLSRKTVARHMAEQANNNDMLSELAMMAPHVMNQVLQKALNEQDIHAARLYMKVTGAMLQQQAAKPNYISIEGSIITQADINEMGAEQKAKVLQAINEKPVVDSVEK